MVGGDCGPASFWLGLGKAALMSRDLSRGLKVVQKLAGPCEGTSQTERAVGAKAHGWGLLIVFKGARQLGLSEQQWGTNYRE